MNWRVVELKTLGAGGNGDLCVGLRSDTGEQVVVKFLRESGSAFARKAFEREVRILRQGLPGMVRLLFADLTATRPYYVMPYLHGGSLEKYAGTLADGQLQAVANHVASTLSALHARYVSHGDIKPANVLVSDDGQLRVADPLGNGIGCTMLFSEHHGGTPGYWAPEVMAGNPISCAGDVYSYGATLYELLTGFRPRDGQRLDQAVAHGADSPVIRHLVAICCQSDPSARPTIAEVIRLLQGERWPQIQAARVQRQQFAVAAGIAGILLLIGLWGDGLGGT